VDSLTDLKEKYKKGFCSEIPEGVIELRSEKYMRSRKKEPAGPPICTLLGSDLFRSRLKADHISRRLKLPEVSSSLGIGPAPKGYPKILVVNVQVPEYAPSMFGGARDGPGFSSMFYFAINYEAATAESRGLLYRFMNGGTEEDGGETRNRLKLIMRIANKEEAVESGGVLPAEKSLLDSWNAKPIMAQPQHRYYEDGERYLEAVVDLHLWKFLVRKVVTNAVNRFHLLKWDFALILQGNYEEELPEQLLAGIRMHYVSLSAGKHVPTE